MLCWRAPGRAGPDRTGPCLPPRYRSIPLQSGWTCSELHGASRSFSSAAAGSAAQQAGGGRALPACTHCAAARSWRPSPERRRSRRSDWALRPAEHATVGASSGYRTERGLTAEDLSATLPGGLSGAAAIHLIAHAQLVFVPERSDHRAALSPLLYSEKLNTNARRLRVLYWFFVVTVVLF